jgi:hypothetical protein
MTVLQPPRCSFKGRPPAPDDACADLRALARRLGYATSDGPSGPVLRGSRGAIYAWGRNRLAVESHDARTGRRLRAVIGWPAPCRRGQGRLRLYFHPDWLGMVAAAIGARRLRRPPSARAGGVSP